MEKGCVVKALAGKEKGQIFVLINLDDKYAYLSDGKRLKASKPKRKSFKHIKVFCSRVLSEAELIDQNERVNAKIRKILSNIRRDYV
ncbi:MAG: hypothetical protein E7379_00415 [Clostridiales bacterium]|nr:hypothetical protein [Clostridiales bacterium]